MRRRDFITLLAERRGAQMGSRACFTKARSFQLWLQQRCWPQLWTHMHSTKPNIWTGRVSGVQWRGALLDMTQASPMVEGSELPLSLNISLFMKPAWRIRQRAEWAWK